MKPFNLEEAKAGNTIVCRDGTLAKYVGYVPDVDVLAVIIRDQLFAMRGDGKPKIDREDSYFDLFMDTKKRTVWVNIYPSDSEEKMCGDSWYYATKETADAKCMKSRIACVPVTFEEGDGL